MPAPLTDSEKLDLQHTGHYLAERLGKDGFELVAIGGAAGGKRIRQFENRESLDEWAKRHGITFRTRDNG